jgi:hypothetical protein
MTNHHLTGDTVRALLRDYTPPAPAPQPPSPDSGPFADYVSQALEDFTAYATMTGNELRETWNDIVREAGMIANGAQGRRATQRARQMTLIDPARDGGAE